jgi:hypothetical protein
MMTYLRWCRSNIGLLVLGMVATTGILATAGYYAYAAKAMPDPEIISLPMSYQTKATANPIPNTGVNAEGLSLELWQQDRDASGLTRAQWAVRSHDPAKWLIAGKGRPAVDFHPVEKRIWRLSDGGMFVLRNNCFLHKLAEPTISRAWVEGDGSSGTSGTILMLPDVSVPTRTDGCAVKNHYVEFHVRMFPQMWRYIPAAQFFKSAVVAPVRVPFKVVMIELIK